VSRKQRLYIPQNTAERVHRSSMADFEVFTLMAVAYNAFWKWSLHLSPKTMSSIHIQHGFLEASDDEFIARREHMKSIHSSTPILFWRTRGNRKVHKTF
jgi:hypothetical protein